APRARFVRVEVLNEQSPRQQEIARQQQLGVAVVKSDVILMMTRRRYQVDDSTAQIYLRKVVRPVPEPEEFSQRLAFDGRDFDPLQAGERGVSRTMVLVTMRVHDEQR